MDIILYNIGAVIIILLVSYLIGSIPNSIWIGKVFFNKDPRDYGSGNAGGTNAGRVFGKKVGIIVIILDALKLAIPFYAFWAICTFAPIYNGAPLVSSVQKIYLEGINDTVIKWPVYWLTVIGVSLGHCFPVFYKFRGGKNVSSYVGLIVGTSWAFGIILAIVFFGLLKIKKYVSLASISMAWGGVILFGTWAILIATNVVTGQYAWIINWGPSINCNYVGVIMVAFAATILTIQHRGNITRLIEGNERKISWMK